MTLDTLIKILLRRSTAIFTILLTAFFTSLTMPRLITAAPGDLDTTFGAGRVLTPIGSGEDTGTAVALQSDGKIVMAGSFHNGSNYDFAVVRYKPDGTLDTSFGGTGKVTTSIGIGDERANAILIQPDGKIIAAGYYVNGTASDFALVRYNANGTLDSSFGSGGKLTTQTSSSTDEVYALALQSDDKIVAAGRATNGNGTDFIIVRYNANGGLDNSFNGSGMRFFNFFTDVNDGVQSLAIQSDGKIVAGGYSYNGSSYDFALLRLNTNGSHDASTTTNFGSGTAEEMSSLLIQPDGKIVASGYSNSNFALARYNANFSLDTGFGTGGVLTTSFGTGSNAIGVVYQTDGKIVAAGTTGNDFALARYNTDGSLDTTFSDDGKQTTDLNGSTDGARGIVIQPDGKVAVAGIAFNGSNNDFAIARYNTNGSLDGTFALSGKVTTQIGNRNDDFADIAIQPDGKIVVVGSVNTLADANRNFVAARYNTDGTLDTTFSDDGKVTTNVRGDDEAYAVAIQPDGRIVVAGFSSIGTGADFSIVRYLANGTLDTSFSGDGIDVRNISQTITGIADSNDVIKDVLVQPDGKIVVGGYADNGTPAGADFVIVRYNSDGNSLDINFNGNGIFRSNITGASQSDSVNALALQSDGKYVFAGQTLNGTNYSIAVGRVNTNGLWDNNFDGEGIALVSGNILARDVVLQPDGKVIVAGNTNGSNEDFMLARFTPSGSLDGSFGGGMVITPVGTTHEAITNVALQADGKIIAAGHSLNATTGYDFSVARYNTNGSLDTSFGVGGIAKTIFGNGNDIAGGLALQADGKIVVGGYTNNGSNNDFAIARFVPGADCTYSINPAIVNVSAGSSTGSVTVTTNESYCTWTATSNAAWVSVTGGASSTGGGTVNYSIAANSGAARAGTLTIAGQTFTINQAAAVDVSMPTNLQSLKNNTVIVPVLVSDTTGKGIISYDFRVSYDASVLTPLAPAFDKSGTLSSGFELNVNSGTAGQLLVSGYGTQALTGAGTLLYLRFTATGTAPACGALGFVAFGFNDGNPVANTSGGQLCIINGSVSGTVTNPNSANNQPVPNVTLSAAGNTTFSTTTNADGDYLLEGFGNGNYTVTPSKTGAINNAILSYDAALISRYVVQLETLSANQLAAADVSGSNTVNSYDAALISQYLVNIANPGVTGTWKFTPVSRTYTDLTANQPNQNYTAILMGDVSGNWLPTVTPLAVMSKEGENAIETAVAVEFPRINAGVNQTITVPVSVSDLSGRGFLSFDAAITFDPTVLQLDQVAPFDKNGTLSGNLSINGNPDPTGRISLSAYGINPMQGSGTLINLRFRVIGQAGQVSPLTFERFIFNENQAQSITTNGQITVLAPTAANASISGRVLTASGRGVSNVRVYLTDSRGITRSANTSSFGYYQFEDIPTGAVYTITVVSKKYVFTEPTRILSVSEQLTDVNFIALE